MELPVAINAEESQYDSRLPPAESEARPVFVGREKELQQLMSTMESALAGRGQVAARSLAVPDVENQLWSPLLSIRLKKLIRHC